MPKKKIQHKGKPKHATQESEDIAFRKKENENTEDEYVNVVDYESNRKYNKRVIESNWSKYETSLSDFESGDEMNQTPKTDDFSHLIQTASSDYSHFELNSEKHWKSEESTIPSSNIFNLDLNILSSGLACVPFYELMGLNENDLPVEDKEKFDAAAEKNWKDYNLLREKLSKKLEEPIVKNCDNISRTLHESFLEKLDLGVKVEKNENIDEELGVTDLSKTDKSEKKVEMFKNIESSNKKEGNKPKLFLNENDEDLEDWLDSVLDD